MRVMIALDNDLIAKAQQLTGLYNKEALICETLKALIARESGKRPARLDGSDSDASAPRRS